MNAGAFYLCAAPPALFFLYFILKPGLTKLRRASLSREGEREGERERERARNASERAEAGREPGSSSLRLPKYWDYKRAPPRLAYALFLKPGLTKLQRASLSRERERERERES